MLYLDSEDKTKDIRCGGREKERGRQTVSGSAEKQGNAHPTLSPTLSLYINCTGGDVVPCLALHDTMQYLESDVGTVGFGACMGMSGFLLAAGAKGKRCVLPNTRIMLHHPSGVARGQASDIDNEAKELMRARNYVNRVLAQATGQPLR